jgi:hypothetical protein
MCGTPQVMACRRLAAPASPFGLDCCGLNPGCASCPAVAHWLRLECGLVGAMVGGVAGERRLLASSAVVV